MAGRISRRSGFDRDRRERSGGQGDNRKQRFQPYSSNRSYRITGPNERRVVVSNVVYDATWKELKQFFITHIGEVKHVLMINDQDGNSKGISFVEFETKELAEKALTFPKKELVFKGRELVVKEEMQKDRERVTSNDYDDDAPRGSQFPSSHISGYGGVLDAMFDQGVDLMHGAGGGGNMMFDQPMDLNLDAHLDAHCGGGSNLNSLLQMGPAMLDQLGPLAKLLIPEHVLDALTSGTVTDTVFVANLDYSTSEYSLKQIFRVVGKIWRVELMTDSKGKSKGYGIIQFESPDSAIKAVTMFNGQLLSNRPMTVKLDNKSQTGPGPMLHHQRDMLPPLGPMSMGPTGPPRDMRFDEPRPYDMGPPQRAEHVPIPRNQEQQILQSLIGAIRHNQNQGGNLASQLMDVISNNKASSAAGPELSSNYRSSGSSYQRQSRYPEEKMNNSGGRMYDSMSTRSHYTDFDRPRERPGMQSSNTRSMFDRTPGFGRKLSDTIHISNLSHEVTWQEARDVFKAAGPITFAEIKMDGLRPRGQAIIRYAHSEDALKAISMFDGRQIKGRRVAIQLA